MYLCNGTTLLYIGNQPNVVNQLHFNKGDDHVKNNHNHLK